MALITVTDANYRYPSSQEGQGIQALRDINLEIQKGEFVVVIGHNGSGKSTLAKMLNGLLLPDTGLVLVDGKSTADAEHYWTIRQQVGMVFQNPDNQLIATIVEEDVAFGPENLGVPSAQILHRVQEALNAVDMLKYRRHAPHLLSGGQKQRVAIAGILAMRPRCLVLDEPTAMLDPRGRREVLSTVRKLNKQEGMTVVWITHHMDEAAHADRVIVMEDGRTVLEGTPKQVFSQIRLLEDLDLDVPVVTRLGQVLAEEGFNLPPDILTVEEMVKLLCP
jgi:energy-coupling factor transport system ATP-binding protein